MFFWRQCDHVLNTSPCNFPRLSTPNMIYLLLSSIALYVVYDLNCHLHNEFISSRHLQAFDKGKFKERPKYKPDAEPQYLETDRIERLEVKLHRDNSKTFNGYQNEQLEIQRASHVKNVLSPVLPETRKTENLHLFENNSSDSNENTIENKTATKVTTEKRPITLAIANKDRIMTKDYFRKYTFQDPSIYKGLIIEAWPPSKNRSVGLYINESFTVTPKVEKLTNKSLLVIVFSLPADIYYRQTWRDSWARYANQQTSVVFLMGKDKNLRSDILPFLEEERKRYGDIIRVDGMIEHYHNLTLKSLYALKFFLTKDLFGSKQPKYMLKVDTDTIVNLPKLYHQLKNVEKYKKKKYLLMGCCFCCVGKSQNHCRRLRLDDLPDTTVPYTKLRRIHGTHKLRRVHKYKLRSIHPMRKWEVPDYLYNRGKYPSYLSGGSGYVVSRDSAECMLRQSLEKPYFHLEDVYTTGFLRQACGIRITDNPGFHPIRKEFDLQTDIINHQDCSVDPKKIKKCYRDIKDVAKRYGKHFRGGT